MSKRFGLVVNVMNNNVEGAMRMLRRQVKEEGIVRQLKARRYFEPPGVVRKKEEERSQRRIVKREMKNMLQYISYKKQQGY